MQHVSQLAQVAPVSLFVGPRGEGGGQDPLRHVSEVQVPAALHKRVQAEAPRRGRRLRQARGWGSRWERRARPRGFPGSVGPLAGGGCPGELLWGTLRRAEMGDHPGTLTYLGRVLRCFEWFRDLVDPWWMRGDGAQVRVSPPFPGLGSPLQSPQTKLRSVLPELPASVPSSSITHQVLYAPHRGRVSPLEGDRESEGRG